MMAAPKHIPSERPGETDPLPVLGYATPGQHRSDPQRAMAWIGIIAGALMVLVGVIGVAVGLCMLYIAVSGGVTWDFKWVGLIFLVCGLVLLIPGYWICGKGIRRVQQ